LRRGAREHVRGITIPVISAAATAFVTLSQKRTAENPRSLALPARRTRVTCDRLWLLAALVLRCFLRSPRYGTTGKANADVRETRRARARAHVMDNAGANAIALVVRRLVVWQRAEIAMRLQTDLYLGTTALRGRRATDPCAAVGSVERRLPPDARHFTPPPLPAPTRCAVMVRERTTREQVEPRGDHWRPLPANRVPPLASAPAEIIEPQSWRLSGEDCRQVATYRDGKRETKRERETPAASS